MQTRSLKIELVGDFRRRKTHPRIRLQGQWLAKLGFEPDNRVQVIPGASGELTLRVERGAQ